MRPIARFDFSLSVPGDLLTGAELLFDHALLNGCGGIDLNDNTRRGYPDAARKELRVWYENLAPSPGIRLVQTWRNLVQNPRSPAYDRLLGICQSRHERAELSRRPYYGIGFLSNGKVRGVRFLPSHGLPDDVVQFGPGTCVLEDERVRTIEEMAPDIGDFPHLWRFAKDSSVDRIERLRAVFDQVLHAPAEEAAAAILDEARGLPREHHYLHQAVGTRADGGVVIVVAHGSLEEIGEKARAAGAVFAVVVDNGGSPAVALYRPKVGLRTLVESYYHRPRAIAVAAYALKADPKIYFSSESRAPVTVRSLRETKQIGLTFTTPAGKLRRQLTFPVLGHREADLTAITIANMSVVHGSAGVDIDAPAEFAAHAAAAFRQRFRATPRAKDPTGLRGCWLDNYLTGIYGVTFAIGDIPAGVVPSRPRQIHKLPSATRVLGLDFGATKLKCNYCENGSVVRRSEVPIGRDGNNYDSSVLIAQLQRGVTEAGVDLSLVQAVGASWAGAVTMDIAAGSKIILDMEDVVKNDVLNRERFEYVRNLSQFLRDALRLPPSVRIAAWNDGDVEALCEAHRMGRRQVLLVKLGTTVAGGYVDAAGTTDYLTELGRCVIRTDYDAPRHPFSNIQGFASRLIGTEALYEAGIAAGLPVTRADAGRDYCKLMESNRVARRIVEQMARNLADLLVEVSLHLPAIDHIILRGGLLGDHAVGRVLRTEAVLNVPEDLARKLAFEEESSHSGAFAAAWLASRL